MATKVINDFSEAAPALFSAIVAGGFFKLSDGTICMKITPLAPGVGNAVNISTGVQQVVADSTLVMSVDSEMTFRGTFGEGFS